MVSNLPQLRLDHSNDKIVTADGETVLLLLNGQMVDEIKLLSLNPKNVKLVEYSETPPVRYLNLNVSSVINVVTYDKKIKGLDLNINLNNSFTDRYGTNIANVAVYDTINSFDVQYFMDYRGFDNMIKNQEYTYLNKNYRSIYKGVPSDYEGVYNRLTTEYNRVTKSNTISAKFVVRDSDGSENYTQNIVHEAVETESSEVRYKKIDDSFKSWALDLYYSHNLKDDQVIGFNVVSTFSDADSDSELSSSYDAEPEQNYLIEDKNENESYSIIGEIFYSKPFEKTEWTIGARNRYKYLEQTYNNSYRSDVTQNISYLYSSVTGKIKGKLPYTYNLGVENTNSSSGGDSSNKVDQNDIVIKSSLSLLMSVDDKSNFRYYAYLSSNTPSISMITNNQTHIYDSLIYRGASDLTPYYIVGNQLKYQLNLDKLYFNTTVRYQRFINPYLNTFIEEDNMVVKTYQHHEKLDDFYTSISLSWKPSKYISISPTYGLSDQSVKFNDGREERLTSHYFSGNVKLNYNSWSLLFEDTEPYRNMSGEITSEFGRTVYSQLSYSKKNFNVVGWFLHHPKTSSDITTSNVIDIKEEKIWNGLKSTFGIKVVYSLQIGKDKKRTGKKMLSNSDGSSGLNEENTANF